LVNSAENPYVLKNIQLSQVERASPEVGRSKPSSYQTTLSPRRGPFTGRKVSGFLSTAQENGLGVSNPKYAFA
jgi:hypothetical protein